MKVVFRKYRGLGSITKEEKMKDLIHISTPEVLLVQETKLEEHEFLQSRSSFWKKGEGVTVSARGDSGGIITLCNPSKFDLFHSSSCTHCIFTSLCHKELGHLVSLLNIYVPVLFLVNKVGWNLIQEFLSTHHPENLILAGDMNITLSSHKKGG